MREAMLDRLNRAAYEALRAPDGGKPLLEAFYGYGAQRMAMDPRACALRGVAPTDGPQKDDL
jgi:hypothetical protein